MSFAALTIAAYALSVVFNFIGVIGIVAMKTYLLYMGSLVVAYVVPLVIGIFASRIVVKEVSDVLYYKTNLAQIWTMHEVQSRKLVLRYQYTK